MGAKALAKPIRGVSTIDILRGIEEGEENYVPFPISKERYISSRCSVLKKYEFPDRVYTVKTFVEEGEARVWWKPVKEENTNA